METLACPDGDDQNCDKEIEHLLKHPQLWFKKRFPEVFKEYGKAVDMASNRHGVEMVRLLHEDFLAATFGELGNPECPMVFVNSEKRFYRYDKDEGIYFEYSDDKIVTETSALLHKCAEECNVSNRYDTSPLLFSLSNASRLSGVVKKAKGMLSVTNNYFDTTLNDFIACRNGMLRLSDMQLLPFEPKYRRRNKLSVDYDPSSRCPMFLDTLMQQSLDEDDIATLQKWSGQALIGKNMSQVIVILSGTPGGGKSSLAQVVLGVVGKNNYYTLRTQHLGERFETSFYVGKTLLYGPDASSDLLTQKGINLLKTLTGGDPVNVEMKNAREGGPEIIGSYNVLIICNSLPSIRLEGDSGAWRRRLIVIEFVKAKPQKPIPLLADTILRDEGSGFLNWAIEGYRRHKDDEWKFKETQKQKASADKILLQSESPEQFCKDCMERDENSTLTQEDCFQCYVEYCQKRDWPPLLKPAANPRMDNQIMRQFGIGQRNDIPGSNGKAQRGWKGLKVKQ